MNQRAIVIGNSSGIGLALTRLLLGRGWRVSGLSRSPSDLREQAYDHTVTDVREEAFSSELERVLSLEKVQLMIYCAGIGELFDTARLRSDVETFETNLAGLARSIERALPHLMQNPPATFVGLSSMADALRSGAAPAYAASKAGMTQYLESLAVALRGSGVSVVNVRLGFVDTKMAKSARKPWLLQPEVVADRILRKVISSNPPRRINIPRRLAILVGIARALTPLFRR